MPALTLAFLLRKHDITHVDYLTLDIEGAEFSVLRVFPFADFDIDVFDIEDNFGNYPIGELMEQNGYKKIMEMGVSKIYRRQDHVHN